MKQSELAQNAIEPYFSRPRDSSMKGFIDESMKGFIDELRGCDCLSALQEGNTYVVVKGEGTKKVLLGGTWFNVAVIAIEKVQYALSYCWGEKMLSCDPKLGSEFQVSARLPDALKAHPHDHMWTDVIAHMWNKDALDLVLQELGEIFSRAKVFAYDAYIGGQSFQKAMMRGWVWQEQAETQLDEALIKHSWIIHYLNLCRSNNAEQYAIAKKWRKLGGNTLHVPFPEESVGEEMLREILLKRTGLPVKFVVSAFAHPDLFARPDLLTHDRERLLARTPEVSFLELSKEEDRKVATFGLLGVEGERAYSAAPEAVERSMRAALKTAVERNGGFTVRVNSTPGFSNPLGLQSDAYLDYYEPWTIKQAKNIAYLCLYDRRPLLSGIAMGAFVAWVGFQAGGYLTAGVGTYLFIISSFISLLCNIFIGPNFQEWSEARTVANLSCCGVIIAGMLVLALNDGYSGLFYPSSICIHTEDFGPLPIDIHQCNKTQLLDASGRRCADDQNKTRLEELLYCIAHSYEVGEVRFMSALHAYEALQGGWATTVDNIAFFAKNQDGSGLYFFIAWGFALVTCLTGWKVEDIHESSRIGLGSVLARWITTVSAALVSGESRFEVWAEPGFHLTELKEVIVIRKQLKLFDGVRYCYCGHYSVFQQM